MILQTLQVSHLVDIPNVSVTLSIPCYFLGSLVIPSDVSMDVGPRVGVLVPRISDPSFQDSIIRVMVES